jgi:hypothetical protein
LAPVPPEPCEPAGLETDCCHPAVRTPMTSARTPAPPAAGSTYSVQCSPSAVQPPWGLPGAAPPTRYRARESAHLCLARLWSIWSLGPPPPGGEDGSRGFRSLSHMPAGRVRSHPGVPHPGTFRPQGLITLSTACSPAGLAKARRPTQRVWDSPFRALLHPIRGTPLGASPLLSFPSGRKRPPAATSEDSSDRTGARHTLRPEGRGQPNLALLGFAPSRLSPPPPWDRLPGPAPHALSVGSTPYVLLPSGAPGV